MCTRATRFLMGGAVRVPLFGVALFAASTVAPAVPQAQPAPAAPAMQLPPIAPIARPTYPGEFPLYPSLRINGPGEQWESYLGGPIVRNVVSPTLIPMLPDPAKRNGTAIIYAPGGGFKYLGMNDAEPRRLTELGVTVFVLKYRTDATNRNPQQFLTDLYKYLFGVVEANKRPESGDGKALHATKEALEDGLAAMRTVRGNARQWNIDPQRIGFMGGSAGAMTALDVAYTGDAALRPDFVVAMIGPKKVDPVPATVPPLFLAAATDDPLFLGAAENIYSAWARAGRPVEAHFYERGGHGLAKGTSAERWFDGLVAWLMMHGWLGAAK